MPAPPSALLWAICIWAVCRFAVWLIDVAIKIRDAMEAEEHRIRQTGRRNDGPIR